LFPGRAFTILAEERKKRSTRIWSQVTLVTGNGAFADALAGLEKANPENIKLGGLRKLKTDAIISGSHNDELHLKPYTDSSKHKISIKSFKLPFDAEDEDVSGNIGIVIVNNMLLADSMPRWSKWCISTKFILAHSLLQAIARVNRVAVPRRTRVFVVDYADLGCLRI
jgi:type I restriction enzyme R subunit